jgi:hypothetical protein
LLNSAFSIRLRLEGPSPSFPNVVHQVTQSPLANNPKVGIPGPACKPLPGLFQIPPLTISTARPCLVVDHQGLSCSGTTRKTCAISKNPEVMPPSTQPSQWWRSEYSYRTCKVLMTPLYCHSSAIIMQISSSSWILYVYKNISYGVKSGVV